MIWNYIIIKLDIKQLKNESIEERVSPIIVNNVDKNSSSELCKKESKLLLYNKQAIYILLLA